MNRQVRMISGPACLFKRSKQWSSDDEFRDAPHLLGPFQADSNGTRPYVVDDHGARLIGVLGNFTDPY
jgi:hypothetical protein